MSEAGPKVSVIMTSFNQEAFLAEAIESVLVQTHRNLELLIVDDRSTDASATIAAGYAEKHPARVRLLRHETNRGVSAARNTALVAATGDYVTTIDGDDVFLPDKIAQEVALAGRHGGGVVVYSNFHWIDAGGRRLGTWDEGRQPMPEGAILGAMFGCDFPKSHWGRSELMPRAALGTTMNDPALPIYEDLDLKLQLSAGWAFRYSAEPSHLYRRHGGGLSTSKADVYFSCMRRIWGKRRALLGRLPASERRRLTHRWRSMLANHATSAACQQLERGRRLAALAFLCRGALIQPASWAPRLILRCLLPWRPGRAAPAAPAVAP